MDNRLLSITKLQNLKAIHNIGLRRICLTGVVINHKTTKFESNSQQKGRCIGVYYRCYQSQNYKIWKQLTTDKSCSIWAYKLLSITKLQNLKAIHNHLLSEELHHIVVINHKTTKFESNSQLLAGAIGVSISCYQSQNYKIWKQFTTSFNHNIYNVPSLSITKLQNLKAIHNPLPQQTYKGLVVINHKTIKFKSNSQQYSYG